MSELEEIEAHLGDEEAAIVFNANGVPCRVLTPKRADDRPAGSAAIAVTMVALLFEDSPEAEEMRNRLLDKMYGMVDDDRASSGGAREDGQR